MFFRHKQNRPIRYPGGVVAVQILQGLTEMMIGSICIWENIGYQRVICKEISSSDENISDLRKGRRHICLFPLLHILHGTWHIVSTENLLEWNHFMIFTLIIFTKLISKGKQKGTYKEIFCTLLILKRP